jgi:hypothetical protein
MDNLYAREKIFQAERALCEGLGDIKERLKDAYMCFHPVRKEDFPDELRGDYQWVVEQLTSKSQLIARDSNLVVSGSVEQTLHFMRRTTAAKIAERIRYISRRLGDITSQRRAQ